MGKQNTPPVQLEKVTFLAQKWNDRDWQGKVAFCITVASFFMSSLGVLVGFWGTATNVRNSNMTSRPYPIPQGITIKYCVLTRTDCIESPFENANNMMFTEHFANVGNIPAMNVALDSHAYYDGLEVKNSYEDHPGDMGPHQSFHTSGQTGFDQYLAAVLGRKKLLLRTKLKYSWPGGSEEKCYETTYEPVDRIFAAEGYCPKFEVP